MRCQLMCFARCFSVFLLASLPLQSVWGNSLDSLEYCRNYIDRQEGDPRWQCEPAPKEWRDAHNDSAPPLLVTLKARRSGNIVENILILSPKISAAYEESSRQLFSDLYSQGHTAKFVLFNYEDNHESADRALHYAEKNDFDLVISMGSQTTRYLTDIKYETIPVVSACSKDPKSQKLIPENAITSGSNIAYTSLDIEPDKQVNYLQERFLNNLKKIVVIYDSGNQSSVDAQVLPLKKFLTSKPSIEFSSIEVELSNKFKESAEAEQNEYLRQNLYKKIAHFEQGSQGTDTIFLITGSTELFEYIVKINEYAGQVPVLSVTPSHVSEGEKSVFISLGVSFKNNAKLAADYAHKILRKISLPSELPVGVVSTPDISINFMHAPEKIKIPFYFFENAAFIYDHQGRAVRCSGRPNPGRGACQ